MGGLPPSRKPAQHVAFEQCFVRLSLGAPVCACLSARVSVYVPWCVPWFVQPLVRVLRLFAFAVSMLVFACVSPCVCLCICAVSMPVVCVPVGRLTPPSTLEWEKKMTALHFAIVLGRVEMIRLLIANGARADMMVCVHVLLMLLWWLC